MLSHGTLMITTPMTPSFPHAISHTVDGEPSLDFRLNIEDCPDNQNRVNFAPPVDPSDSAHIGISSSSSRLFGRASSLKRCTIQGGVTSRRRFTGTDSDITSRSSQLAGAIPTPIAIRSGEREEELSSRQTAVDRLPAQSLESGRSRDPTATNVK